MRNAGNHVSTGRRLAVRNSGDAPRSAMLSATRRGGRRPPCSVGDCGRWRRAVTRYRDLATLRLGVYESLSPLSVAPSPLPYTRRQVVPAPASPKSSPKSLTKRAKMLLSRAYCTVLRGHTLTSRVSPLGAARTPRTHRRLRRAAPALTPSVWCFRFPCVCRSLSGSRVCCLGSSRV